MTVERIELANRGRVITAILVCHISYQDIRKKNLNGKWMGIN